MSASPNSLHPLALVRRCSRLVMLTKDVLLCGANSSRVAWLVSLGLSLSVIFSQVSTGQEQAGAEVAQEEQKDNGEYYELMKVFVDTFEQIDQNYVTEVEKRQLVEAAIRGMLSELDPYSNYISPEDLDRFDQDINQEFGGIGIQVHFDTARRQIVVVSPLPGTPAYRAGIRAGDRIVEIEGEPVADFKLGDELNTAVKLMKGRPGELVSLGVLREGAMEPENIDVERAIIKISTVMGDFYKADGTSEFFVDQDNKIAYVRLTHFSANSAKEMRRTLRDLEKQGMKGLVLDLRYNPGGLLAAAVEIADMFIESGKIVSTKGKMTPEQTWRARRAGTFSNFPMAVLVNRYSASASEILSACLQDHDRAVVVGERTWGKGSVQNIIELEGGSSALKLTTASYHRPSGENIHRFKGATEKDVWGVMPTDGFKVRFDAKQLREHVEYRRDRDVISEDGPPEGTFKDTQFDKAYEYVLSQLNPEAAEEVEAEADEEEKVEEESVKTSRNDAAMPVSPKTVKTL